MRTILTGLAMTLAAFTAHAQTFVWVNPDGGDWNEPTNWSVGAAPVRGSSIRFDLDAAYTVFGPSGFEGRRLAVDRGELRLMREFEAGSNWASFDESELANPPAVRIGSLEGGRVSLTTDFPISSTFTLVGPAGHGSLTTTSAWSADDLVVGGVADASSAIGEVLLDGDLAWLSGRGRDAVTDATIGLAGAGRLTLRNGAAAEIGTLRLAIGADAGALVEVDGAGTHLDADRLEGGEGDGEIVVSSGGSLSFRDAQSLLVHPDGSLVFRISGGVVEGATEFGVSGESIAIDISAGGSMRIEPGLRAGEVTVRDAGSLLSAGEINAGGPVRIEQGGQVHIRGGKIGRVLSLLGDPTIDGGTLLIDDGTDAVSSRGFATALGRLSPRDPVQRFSIRGGAIVEAEGLLVMQFMEESRIVGAGTVLRQRTQLVEQSPFEPPGSEVFGYTVIQGRPPTHGSPEPLLTIGEGARVEASSLDLSGRIAIENATIAVEELLRTFGEITMRSTSRVETPRVLVSAGIFSGLGVLRGSAVLNANLSNGSTLDPGDEQARASIGVDGEFIQREHRLTLPDELPDSSSTTVPPGLLHIDIAGETDHDMLEVTGAALLGGTLRIELHDEYTPAWGDTVTALTAGAIDGEFETLQIPASPPGLFYEVEYTDTTVSFVVHRDLDLTRDFRIDSADLSALLTSWGRIIDTPEQTPDFNRDGLVDGADLGVLLGAWGQTAN